MVWATLLHESWKRKQNLIANSWLVRDFHDATTERSDFRYETAIDPKTQEQVKITLRRGWLVQMIVGVPLSIMFMVLVVSSQLVMLYWDYQQNKSW